MKAFLTAVLLVTATQARASESDALAIDEAITERHLPYGAILSPVFSSPTTSEVVSYTRCGDSAIWTGHYLAAEAFRYAVTRSPQALANATRAVSGLQSLNDVTGTGLLARCALPIDSPYAAAISSEEAGNGVRTGTVGGAGHLWIGNTSRDQYVGVFFGLGVAYDLIPDPAFRARVSALGTRLLDFLLDKDWAVVMPDGKVSTVFWGRADQQLSILQVGRRLNPARFEGAYKTHRLLYAGTVSAPIAYDVLDPHTAYYKFNLAVISFYNLLRLEDSSYYRWWFKEAYDVLRKTIDDHQNAHFNMIDRALNGASETRDAETRSLLEQWLLRPRRDFAVDLRSKYRSCGEAERACSPIPVAERVRTDFLWQRSPFLLYGGDVGNIETPGIDYILPYWMGRYYGTVTAEPSVPRARHGRPR